MLFCWIVAREVIGWGCLISLTLRNKSEVSHAFIQVKKV